MNNVNGLPPFKRLCVTIGNLPSSYVDSMSYYECLMWLCKYLKDTVIPAINENAEAVNELINWFNNLDVQDEIDKKLDEMAESGELEEIISAYLNTNAILGYNTVANLKSATNIIDGSLCRTFGKSYYNDGQGAFYKIRTVTSGDVVDEENILSLDVSNTLIAEKIIDIVTSEKIIFLGDSYGATSGSFTYRMKEMLVNNNNINEDDIYIWNIAGANAINASSYLTQLQNNNSVIPNTYKPLVKKIILCAGYNDASIVAAGGKTPEQLLEEGLIATINYAKQQYPNATIYLGCIAGNGNPAGNTYNYTINTVPLRVYKKVCNSTGALYLNNVECLMRRYDLYDNDYIHPNDTGDQVLASGIYSSLFTGDINYFDYYYDAKLDLVSNITNNSDNNNKLALFQNVENDVVTTFCGTKRYILTTVETLNTDFKQQIHLSNSSPLYIHAQNIFTCIPVDLVLHCEKVDGTSGSLHEACSGYLQVTTSGVNLLIEKTLRDTAYGIKWIYMTIPNYTKRRIDC